MLVRQAICFTWNREHVGTLGRFSCTVAEILLTDYGSALGLDPDNQKFNNQVRDYGQRVGYSMSWQAPGDWYGKLSTIGHNDADDAASSTFSRTPIIGCYRPCLYNEVLGNREIEIRLETLLRPERQ